MQEYPVHDMVQRDESGSDMNANKLHCMASLPKGMRRIALVLAALAFATVLAFAGSLQVSSQAYANIYPASEASAAADQASGKAASDQAAATDDQKSSEGETIEDDETPMSSGLGGGEPLASSSNGIKWVVIIGIAAVVAFFVASTLRMNKSIDTMKNRFKR